MALAVIMSVTMLPGAALANGFLPTKVVEGRTYEAKPPSAQTAILLIGYDRTDDGRAEISQMGHISGGQSDFLLLVLLDHEHRQIRRLHIDRDTMADVKVYSFLGHYLGSRELQICLSHAYGNTQEKNNANTVWAVEELLGISDSADGAQIDWYLTMDISGINRLNEALGGVTVPIEDDFSAYDATMVQGTTMRLTGDQAEIYTRYRYKIGEQSNRSRMVRQQAFMSSAGDLLMSRTREDLNYPRRLLNEMGVIFDRSKELDDGFGFTTSDNKETPLAETPANYLMTNETLDRIVGQMNKTIDYELLEVETLPGTHSVGADGFIRFDLEEGAAKAWALNAFYNLLP